MIGFWQSMAIQEKIPSKTEEPQQPSVGQYKYIKHERIYLKEHPHLHEGWVQQKIADDPSILGLGTDLVLRDKERPQPRAGRLDILLQDPETSRRYEVEVQLGRTDEAHIIRTIEYWDIERRRYPQYDHCAVLIAEDVTSRFLNVLSLFNGSIPLIAIQMQALNVGNQMILVFTTVLDELTRGAVDEDEEIQAVADRSYWENRGTKVTVGMADRLFEMIREFDSGLEMKYNRFYIGLAKSGQPNNFITFCPRKTSTILTIKLKQSDDIEKQIEQSGLDAMEYDKRNRGYRIRLDKEALAKGSDTLKQLMKMAYDNRTS